MLIWKNTSALESFEDGLNFTEQKSAAEIAVLGSKPITINDFPNLKGIFRAGISSDNVPIKEAKEHNILVCFPSIKTRKIVYNETANFTCSFIFKMIYSNLGSIDPWKKYGRDTLVNKHLLVIGMGNIGNLVYDKMQHFMMVDSFDIIHNEIVELKEKISNANVISLHIPMSEENISFIDTQKLSWMKNNSILINTARANLVNEEAIYLELNSGRLRAAFDVFWTEPYQGKLLDFPDNIFLKTPHVASNCKEFGWGCRVDLDAMITRLTG